MIENPVGRLSYAWRKPDLVFNPCDYGDPYTKHTCIWVGGGFKFPEKNYVKPVKGSLVYNLVPQENRENIRSETPSGFAKEVFKANYVNSCSI